MRAAELLLLCLPALLVQGQFSRFEGITYPEPVQYSQYDQQGRNSGLLRLPRCHPPSPGGAVPVPIPAAIPAGNCASPDPSCGARDGAHGAGTARLPGGAVPLHPALLRAQALQAVPERDLLLQPPPGLCHQQGDLRPHRVRPRGAAASRPVPGQVLQVRGDGHERPVPDRGRVLRPQLRRLLSPGPAPAPLRPRPAPPRLPCMKRAAPRNPGIPFSLCT
ncbi:microfibrillar-associated protein 2 isoform X1 [Camarhynchus parvulus]|uniref:microfibrillar-associated protein 2 isoform X1 n=1 Tax=Geospiza parvula TaxID=87175 RepID=UPI001238034F|nr:microfibrillar-associated protein 2 isoform X1 [Camarhynchus parvulus]XP_030819556.1 microfibrillar-associated protein 2 isoform X1 [Camarhynchus parvulus]